jgi:multidrug efflux pump
VSRTEYQYIPVDANSAKLAEWAPRLIERLRATLELQNVASDQQTGGIGVELR